MLSADGATTAVVHLHPSQIDLSKTHHRTLRMKTVSAVNLLLMMTEYRFDDKEHLSVYCEGGIFYLLDGGHRLECIRLITDKSKEDSNYWREIRIPCDVIEKPVNICK